MKTKFLFLFWGLIGSLSFAFGQENLQKLTLSPAQPQPGDTIKITYDPTGSKLAGKEIEAVLYMYDHDQLETYDVPLTQAIGRWKGSIPISSNSSGFFLYFTAGEDYDNNEGKGYSFLLYDAENKPVKGAYGSLATAQSNWLSLMKMERDLEEAFANLEEEFSRFPESKRVFMNTYARLMAAEKPEQSGELILQELDALAEELNQTGEQLAQLSFLYRGYKHKEKADQLAEKSKQLDPKGIVAQQEVLAPFYDEKDLAKKQALAEEFVRKFPESEQVDWVLASVAREMAEQEQYGQFEDFLARYPQAASWYVYNSAAWNMAEAGKELAMAHEFATKSYAMAQQELANPTAKKPDWISEKQWRESRLQDVGMVADTYAFILLQQDKPAEALPLLEEAAKLQKEQNVEINERHVAALLKNEKLAEAKNAMERYISSGHSNAQMKQYLREVYAKEYGSEDGYEAYVRKVEAPALEKMQAAIREKLISEPAPAFALKDLNGNTVSLADLKGRTVIVDFWATWCGPCISSFPGMQQAVNKFKDDEQVAFVFINSWENGEDKEKVAGDFIRKRDYSFNVLLDTDNKTIGDFKVEGIPTKFVIDKEGNIRYRNVGFGGNDEATVMELSMLIELLR